eukprot:scaffold128682_cov63-Phaeocystis_antarctica.AAC.3
MDTAAGGMSDSARAHRCERGRRWVHDRAQRAGGGNIPCSTATPAPSLRPVARPAPAARWP